MADLDLDPDDERAGVPFRRAARPAFPAFHLDVLAAVFVGGCVGGYSRYAAVTAWPAPPGGFPWSTLAVNTVGALVLALVVVVAAELAPSRYLRPLVGTGFCGALTTFSAIVVSTDRLLADDRWGIAVGYLLGSMAAGLAAAAAGLLLGRALTLHPKARRSTS